MRASSRALHHDVVANSLLFICTLCCATVCQLDLQAIKECMELGCNYGRGDRDYDAETRS